MQQYSDARWAWVSERVANHVAMAPKQETAPAPAIPLPAKPGQCSMFVAEIAAHHASTDVNHLAGILQGLVRMHVNIQQTCSALYNYCGL